MKYHFCSKKNRRPTFEMWLTGLDLQNNWNDNDQSPVRKIECFEENYCFIILCKIFNCFKEVSEEPKEYNAKRSWLPQHFGVGKNGIGSSL